MRLLFLAAIAWGAAAQSITAIMPANASLQPGSVAQYRCFYAGTGPVVWSITPAIGAISQTGLYTAPASIPSAVTLTVTCAINGASSSVSAFLKAAPPPSATWVYQEIPTGGMDPTLAGTGFYLTLKCTPVPGTVHLWLNGALLYETGKDQVGAVAPAGSYYVLDKRLAGVNINVQAEGCGAGLCPQMRVDYQFSSCP